MDTKRIFKKAVNLLTLSSFLLWNLSVAAPEGGSVAQGSATISQSGAQTTINQSSQNAVINWNSFNTASHEAVQFNQPNASSVALNRITNGLPTQFAGSLNANGQVWILNPAGVLFTNTARVDVAGLVATTHGILDSNFMSGNYRFDLVPGSEYASIINNGLISAKDSGIVALVAPHVANNGLIQANLGKVSLSSGAAYTLDMYGDSLINFGSNAPIQNGTVSNAGNIIANGGKVYMTANYASGVLDNMISMSGTVQAKSVGVNQKGEIVLYGGDYQAKKMSGVTKVSGKLKVSSDDKSIGGFIETSGGYVEIAPAAEIDAGMGGTWLLDPWNITVVAGSGLVNNGGATGFVPSGTNSQIGANLINAQLGAGTNVILDTNSVGGDVGNITISSPVTWSTAAVLTLIANNNIAVNAALNGSTTGFVSLQAGGSITGAGVISANTLTTSSVTGLSLTGLNTAANFNATNTTSGNIAYTHTGALNITGITQNVGNLTISNTGAITQSGPISVSGTSSFTAGAGAITLNDPANNLVGAVTFSNTGANNVSIVNNPNLILGASTIGGSFSASTNASSITLNGNITSGVGQTYNDPLLINANLTLTSTAGVLIFTSTIDDTALRSHTLTLASPGLVVFGGAVGGTTALNTLNLTQNSFTVDPTLASFIAGQLNVGTNVRLTSTAGDVTIGSPITQTISVVPITLSLVASNLINLNSSISLLPGSTLSLRQPSFTVDPTLATYI
ncbi:MAG: filamentous hemagglutinin N-terminal domain-containing protein, partial [Gammaproteobacteria bacterium]|nr:filamentous hemagglutinin N-terminal domain-containing protein [Gammaproteobacteria bacterium]